jgi:hypothetical protein
MLQALPCVKVKHRMSFGHEFDYSSGMNVSHISHEVHKANVGSDLAAGTGPAAKSDPTFALARSRFTGDPG